VKVGDKYLRVAIDDDVRNLYSTGLFYNIRVGEDNTPAGMVLTYIVQGKPRLTEIAFHGNKKFSDAKLRKKLTSKVGEPMDERKLFTDSQDIQTIPKAGYPRTVVKYDAKVIEETGRATVTLKSPRAPRSRSSKWISSAQGLYAEATAQSHQDPQALDVLPDHRQRLPERCAWRTIGTLRAFIGTADTSTLKSKSRSSSSTRHRTR
jgi:hypothetical protein